MERSRLDPNRQFLNKWEMYKVLRQAINQPYLLPETEILEKHSFQKLSERFENLYVKPVGSWGGHDISCIRIQKNTFIWKLQGEADKQYTDLEALWDDLHLCYQDRECVIQQAAPILRYKNRPFDIRVHMQRELDNSWVHAGTLARVGGRHAIVSNVGVSKGSVVPVETVLSQLNIAKNEMSDRLAKTGFSICQILEDYRTFNEIGVDLGIDDAGTPWVIEVNTDDALGSPSIELFRNLPDQTVFEEMSKRYEARQKSMLQTLFDAFFANMDDQ